MASDHLALIETILRRWNEGDRKPREDEIDPDAEFHTRLAAVAGEPYRGYPGIEGWVRDIDEQFDRWAFEVDEMIETDAGHVLALGSLDLRGRGSEVQFTQEVSLLFEFRNGRISRMEVFQSQAEGRKAAGLL